MKKAKVETTTVSASTYFKSDLIKSKRYESKQDILSAVLKDDTPYTLTQVDKLVQIFLDQKEVK